LLGLLEWLRQPGEQHDEPAHHSSAVFQYRREHTSGQHPLAAMTITKKGGIVAGLALAVVFAVLICSALARRSFHKAAIIRDSGALLGLVDDWRKAGEPEGEAAEKLLANYGSTKPFVYTNAVNVGKTNFVCAFAIHDAAFAERGKLVVTREGTIIWIGENGSRIIPINR
jgi:hypothetical protein